MKPTAIERFETRLVQAINTEHGGRLGSVAIATALAGWIRQAQTLGKTDRGLARSIRLMIKVWPTNPDLAPMLYFHRETMRRWAADALAAPVATIAACNALAVPVILSCRKYLATAHRLQAAFRGFYFGIQPIVICGDPRAMQERWEGATLVLPVDDSYEGLPRKVFEAVTLFDALGAEHGIIKLDDDLHFVSQTPPTVEALRAFLAVGDYVGTAAGGGDVRKVAMMQDRTWHAGKCEGPVPAVYGKPTVGPYASGGLYYLSGRALGAVAQHFMQYPDIVAGELYEDKAIGDTLHGLGLTLHAQSLAPILGVSFEGDGDRMHAPGTRGGGDCARGGSWMGYAGAGSGRSSGCMGATGCVWRRLRSRRRPRCRSGGRRKRVRSPALGTRLAWGAPGRCSGG